MTHGIYQAIYSMALNLAKVYSDESLYLPHGYAQCEQWRVLDSYSHVGRI